MKFILSSAYHEKPNSFSGKNRNRNLQIIANENKNTMRYGLEIICNRNPF